MENQDAVMLADISAILRAHNKVQHGISDAEAIYRIKKIVLEGDNNESFNKGDNE